MYYVGKKTKRFLGIVKTTVEIHTPDVVEFQPEEVKAIEELHR